MRTIQVGEGLQIDVHDGPEPVMYLHNNNDDNGYVVVKPGQVTALRDALAEAGGVAAAMVAGEDVRERHIRAYGVTWRRRRDNAFRYLPNGGKKNG